MGAAAGAVVGAAFAWLCSNQTVTIMGLGPPVAGLCLCTSRAVRRRPPRFGDTAQDGTHRCRNCLWHAHLAEGRGRMGRLAEDSPHKPLESKRR